MNFTDVDAAIERHVATTKDLVTSRNIWNQITKILGQMKSDVLDASSVEKRMRSKTGEDRRVTESSLQVLARAIAEKANEADRLGLTGPSPHAC